MTREVLVKIRSADVVAIQAVEQDADTEHAEDVGNGHQLRLIRSRSKNVEALIQQLSKRSDVEYVEPNYIITSDATPSDPSFNTLWALKNTGQNGGIAVGHQAEAAWDLSKGSSAVAVGVIDSGIDYNHSDLNPNVWSAPSAFTVTIWRANLMSLPAHAVSTL